MSLGWNSVVLSHQCSPTQDMFGIKLVPPAASQAMVGGGRGEQVFALRTDNFLFTA